MSKVYRASIFVETAGPSVSANVYEFDCITVDGVEFARVLDRLEPIRESGPYQFHATREAALTATASKLTAIASEMLVRAEEMREEAAGV